MWQLHHVQYTARTAVLQLKNLLFVAGSSVETWRSQREAEEADDYIITDASQCHHYSGSEGEFSDDKSKLCSNSIV